MYGMRVDGLLPWYHGTTQDTARATRRLTPSERKTKYRNDGGWENSAASGIFKNKEVIIP
ncbi:hypothetical protein NITUZ_30012 [Candidatus Nitrosotenuis uzonensis]|uniref:Uncharacterized protein n=1 Tax=Candidatus Nitrosotenuis uzonensis TaxID=1407055 RepID=V6AS08_9ARCH|nr:hypothetical protein NITUZ_30012 [Candidatus Nitrosotenuis uzonensis]